MTLTFVHAADLHLDSPLQTSALPDDLDQLRSATFDAWDRLVQFCLDRQVSFPLLAGDVFDDSTRTLKAILAFRQGLKRLEEQAITVFLIHGNHDPFSKWPTQFELPANTHRLGATGVVETVLFPPDAPQVAISGVCYPERHVTANLAGKFKAEYSQLFQIAMLHCACGDQPEGNYASCGLSDLKDTGFDYWALGHRHAHQCLSDNPWIGYAGCPQGRHPHETGEHGCWLVSVDTDQHQLAGKPKFIALDNLRWHVLEIDIAEMESQLQLVDYLAAQVQATCDESPQHTHILRLTLIGRTSVYHQLATGEQVATVLEELRDQLAHSSPTMLIDALTNNTAPPIDLERRAQVDDLMGQLLTVASDIGADPQRLEELQQTLEDLWHYPMLKRTLDKPSQEQLQDWLKQAAYLCFDLLESGDSQ